MKPIRVCLLDGGSMAIDGHKIYWNRGPAGDIRFPVYSVLVEHEDGLFLYDTGFDLEFMQTYVPQDHPIQSPDQTLPAQLAKVGYRPEDVTHVIDSHLHIDHCGGNNLFPQAKVVCHEKEYEQARNPELFEGLSYGAVAWFAPQLVAHRQEIPPGVDPTLSPEFELLSGDLEFAPGVRLLETLGHSAGHYSMLVELQGRRPMLFTGDAAMTPKNLEMMVVGGFHLDPVAGTRSLQRLKDLAAEHDAELFFSHSMPEFETWKKAPEWYA
ncbi:MAG: N-acyl homoserine lactonase family protein [bacterium]